MGPMWENLDNLEPKLFGVSKNLKTPGLVNGQAGDTGNEKGHDRWPSLNWMETEFPE